MIARIAASGSAAWYLTDRLGSVRQIVNGSNGTVLDQLVYTSYGSILSESHPENGDRFKFAGGEYDSISGDYRFLLAVRLFRTRLLRPLALRSARVQAAGGAASKARSDSGATGLMRW